MSYPKISIITPSYNQGEFIEETIQSVIGQNYPNLEYIIVDGGSTDQTLDVIKKYESFISKWVSEKDNGQSHAINKGIAMSTGSIIAWLNSDDFYLPGSLNYMSEQFNKFVGPTIHYLNCIHLQYKNGIPSTYVSNVGKYKLQELEVFDYIIQPSTFWNRPTLEEVGFLREDLNFGFDWEWFLRAKSLGVSFYSGKKVLSVYRIHDKHKTGTGGNSRQLELLKIYKESGSKYADLFEKLMNENLNSNDFSYKLISKFFSFLGQSKSYIDILKFLKSEKYGKYSENEIKSVMSTL
ncbi:MAG: glycosyltransferase family 2 protein [Bacteroidota bacterium]